MCKYSQWSVVLHTNRVPIAASRRLHRVHVQHCGELRIALLRTYHNSGNENNAYCTRSRFLQLSSPRVCSSCRKQISFIRSPRRMNLEAIATVVLDTRRCNSLRLEAASAHCSTSRRYFLRRDSHQLLVTISPLVIGTRIRAFFRTGARCAGNSDFRSVRGRRGWTGLRAGVSNCDSGTGATLDAANAKLRGGRTLRLGRPVSFVRYIGVLTAGGGVRSRSIWDRIGDAEGAATRHRQTDTDSRRGQSRDFRHSTVTTRAIVAGATARTANGDSARQMARTSMQIAGSAAVVTAVAVADESAETAIEKAAVTQAPISPRGSTQGVTETTAQTVRQAAVTSETSAFDSRRQRKRRQKPFVILVLFRLGARGRRSTRYYKAAETSSHTPQTSRSAVATRPCRSTWRTAAPRRRAVDAQPRFRRFAEVRQYNL